MSRSITKGGRPDWPSESARRAAVTAEDALVGARAYVTDPKRQGHGRDLSHLAEKLDDALTDLAVLRENLSTVASADAPPDTFYDVMQRVDQTFVDLIVHGHIEDWKSILHGPKETVRSLVNETRGK